MNKKNKKLAVFLIGFIIIFCIVMIVLFAINNLRGQHEKLYIIVDNDAMWSYKKGKWEIIQKKDAKSYNWMAFDVYLGNSFSERDYLTYVNDKWYIFDNAKQAIIPNEKVLAIGGNVEVSVLDFSVNNIGENDLDYVRNILGRNGIVDTERFTTSEKILVDLDNDKEKEELFIVSNIFPDGFIPSISYNLIFVRDGNDTYIVYKNISKFSSSYSGCKAYVNNILDVDGDKKYEILVGCGYFSTQGRYYSLYSLKDKKYQLLISN